MTIMSQVNSFMAGMALAVLVVGLRQDNGIYVLYGGIFLLFNSAVWFDAYDKRT